MRVRCQARVEVEVPGVAVKMRNRVLVDLFRRSNEDRTGDPLNPEIEEGEEVPEVGVGYQPVLEDGEAYMQSVGGPGVLNLRG